MLKWKMSKDESVFQHYEKSECRKAVYSLDAITKRKKRERDTWIWMLYSCMVNKDEDGR